MSQISFLGLEGRHVFITGGAGGVGSAAAKEFLGKNFKEVLELQMLRLVI
jgi:FlaA1/EpsC-like NDP-sugar epimerase